MRREWGEHHCPTVAEKEENFHYHIQSRLEGENF